MADNSVRTPGSGETIRTIDKSAGAFKTPTTQLDIGTGTAESLVNATNPLPIAGLQDSSTTVSVTTSSSTGTITVSNRNVVTVTISGTYAGVNLTFEASDDGGTTYFSVQGARVDTGIVEATSGVLVANSSRGWDFPIGAWTHFKTRSTAYTSGTGTVRMTAQTFAFDPCPAAVAQGPAAAGAAIAGNPVLMGGSDGTNARAMLTGTDGRIASNTSFIGGVAVPLDNAGFTDTVTPVTPVGFIFDDVAGTALTENDVGAARMNVNRALVGTIEDGATRGAAGARSVRVLAVNTAAVAANDTSIVVQLSPIQPNLTTPLNTILTTGSAAIGKLTANTGVIIGDVNVVSIIPTTTATSIAKAKGGTPGATDTGVVTLVRSLTVATATTTATWDYMQQESATGALYVNSPVNTATGITKQRAATPGATDSGPAIFVEALTTPTAVTTAQYHRPQMDAATGGLWVHPIAPSFRFDFDTTALTTVTTAYTAGDVLNGAISITNAARISGAGGVINTCVLVDQAIKCTGLAIEVWFFNAAPTVVADNAVWDVTDATMKTLCGIVTFDVGSWKSNTSNAVNVQPNLNIGYNCAVTTLVAYPVIRGVPTGNFFAAVSDLHFVFNMLRD